MSRAATISPPAWVADHPPFSPRSRGLPFRPEGRPVSPNPRCRPLFPPFAAAAPHLFTTSQRGPRRPSHRRRPHHLLSPSPFSPSGPPAARLLGPAGCRIAAGVSPPVRTSRLLPPPSPGRAAPFPAPFAGALRDPLPPRPRGEASPASFRLLAAAGPRSAFAQGSPPFAALCCPDFSPGPSFFPTPPVGIRPSLPRRFFCRRPRGRTPPYPVLVVTAGGPFPGVPPARSGFPGTGGV